jgi:hypothetical protein
VTLEPGRSDILTLDGETPPADTICRVTARTAGRVVEGDNFTSGPAMYRPKLEYILTAFLSARGPDIGFEVHANRPTG